MKRRKLNIVGTPDEPFIPRLLAAKAAATKIGIPYTTLRDLTFRGFLPVIKIGRAWYYDQKDIAEFIANNKERLK